MEQENFVTDSALIQSGLPIREIFACYYDNEDNYSCRKPKPGLIPWAAKIWVGWEEIARRVSPSDKRSG